MTHPTADAARKFIRTAGVPSYDGYELQIRELADALDATMTKMDVELKPGWLQRDIERAAAQVNKWENQMTTGPTLSERLRKPADYWTDVPGILLRYEREREEAATALDAQAALVKELAEALEPFSAMAGELFARNWNNDQVVIALDNPDDPHRVTAKDFFAVRAVLTKYKAQSAGQSSGQSR